MKSKFDAINDSDLQTILDNSCSLRDVLLKVGLTANGGNSYDSLKKRIKKSQLSTDRFAHNTSMRNIKTHGHYSDDEYFCENSKATRLRVKKRIINRHLIPHICSACGITDTWNGKKLYYNWITLMGLKMIID